MLAKKLIRLRIKYATQYFLVDGCANYKTITLVGVARKTAITRCDSENTPE